MAKDIKDKPLTAKLAYGRKRGTKASVLAQASKRRLQAKFNDQTLSEAAAIMGRKGGIARAKKLTPEQRRAAMHKALKARWDKYRENNP